MRKHLLCTLLNASSLINGIAFAESEDPAGMLSVDPIDETDEVAAALLTIPGYEVVEVADKGGKATGPTQAELDAEAARKAAAEREAAEKAAAEAAAAEQAEKDAAAAAEAEAAAKAEQEAEAAEAAAAAQKEADELAALEAEIAAEEAAKAEGEQADPPAETTAAPKASGGKSKGSK